MSSKMGSDSHPLDPSIRLLGYAAAGGGTCEPPNAGVLGGFASALAASALLSSAGAKVLVDELPFKLFKVNWDLQPYSSCNSEKGTASWGKV